MSWHRLIYVLSLCGGECLWNVLHILCMFGSMICACLRSTLAVLYIDKLMWNCLVLSKPILTLVMFYLFKVALFCIFVINVSLALSKLVLRSRSLEVWFGQASWSFCHVIIDLLRLFFRVMIFVLWLGLYWIHFFESLSKICRHAKNEKLILQLKLSS